MGQNAMQGMQLMHTSTRVLFPRRSPIDEEILMQVASFSFQTYCAIRPSGVFSDAPPNDAHQLDPW